MAQNFNRVAAEHMTVATQLECDCFCLHVIAAVPFSLDNLLRQMQVCAQLEAFAQLVFVSADGGKKVARNFRARGNFKVPVGRERNRHAEPSRLV